MRHCLTQLGYCLLHESAVPGLQLAPAFCRSVLGRGGAPEEAEAALTQVEEQDSQLARSLRTILETAGAQARTFPWPSHPTLGPTPRPALRSVSLFVWMRSVACRHAW